jgi:YD repeat-containing protein
MMATRILLRVIPALVAGALSACASASLRTGDCTPTIYLDSRGAILAAEPGPHAPTGCYQLTYDGSGRVVRIDYRRSGALSPDPVFGAASVLIEHAPGKETRTYRDADGRPVTNANGVARVRLRRDEAGRLVEWASFGVDGRRAEERDSGLAIVRWSYDARGNVVEEQYLGAAGRLKNSRHRGVAIVRWTYDALGRTLEERYLGPDGSPKEDRQRGVAAVRWAYDGIGKVAEERYLGPDERPTEDTQRGVAAVRWRHDAHGNTLEERYLGVDGRLKEDARRGVAILRWDYDEQGRTIATTMFDRREIPVPAFRRQ